MPSEPLKPEEVTINLRTPTCTFCGKHDVLVLTREEFRAVNNGILSIQDALPNRSPEFREQIISGTHPKCWEDNMRPEDDEKV
jgi:hypothetical protein